MKKTLSLILIATFMCTAMLFLSSCDNNSVNSSPTGTATENASPDDTQTAAGGKLICGITEFEPMNFRDANGNWTGFDTEFALLVGEKLGMEVEFQMIDWTNKFAELNSGAITMIWNGFTANTTEGDTGIQRIDLCDMTYSYMLNQQCVVVKAERLEDFMEEDDLLGKTAAAESGSAGETEAIRLVGDSGEVVGAAAQINTFLEVKSGASDFAVVDVLLAERITESEDYADLAIAPIELDFEVYAIGLIDGSELTALINKAMLELYEDGTLTQLAEKYGLENNLVIDTGYGG